MALPADPTSERVPSRSKLDDLLIREAHLALCRSTIAPALATQEERLRTLAERRPMLAIFQSKEKRLAAETELNEATRAAETLRNGIAQVDRAALQLGRMLRDEIEDMLRASCSEYVQALAARQQKQDWQRCLERFARRVGELLQALGSARNMACSGYTRERQMYSQAAVEGFVIAIACAEKVEAEIGFANRIRGLQAELFQQAGLAATALPALEVTPYSVAVAKICTCTLLEAQLKFESLIAQVRQLHEETVPLLLAQSDTADQSHRSLLENFLDQAWQQLREEITPAVDPAETEASVVSTEAMLLALGRASVHGRMLA